MLSVTSLLFVGYSCLGNGMVHLIKSPGVNSGLVMWKLHHLKFYFLAFQPHRLDLDPPFH